MAVNAEHESEGLWLSAEAWPGLMDLVQAGRLANPVFSFGRVKNHHGGEVERQLMVPVIGLLTMPITRKLEQRRFAQAQMRTAGEALRIALKRIDKAAAKGVIHKNKAARAKSRLLKQVARIQATD